MRIAAADCNLAERVLTVMVKPNQIAVVVNCASKWIAGLDSEGR